MCHVAVLEYSQSRWFSTPQTTTNGLSEQMLLACRRIMCVCGHETVYVFLLRLDSFGERTATPEIAFKQGTAYE